MDGRLGVAAAVAGALVLVWLVLIGLLLVAARRDARRVSLREAVRLVPDILHVDNLGPGRAVVPGKTVVDQ